MQDSSNILQGWSLEKGDYLFLKPSLVTEGNIIFFRYLEKGNDDQEKPDKKDDFKIDFLSIFVESSLIDKEGKNTLDLIEALTGIKLIPVKADDEQLIKIKSLGILQLSEALIFKF